MIAFENLSRVQQVAVAVAAAAVEDHELGNTHRPELVKTLLSYGLSLDDAQQVAHADPDTLAEMELRNIADYLFQVDEKERALKVAEVCVRYGVPVANFSRWLP